MGRPDAAVNRSGLRTHLKLDYESVNAASADRARARS
jgi:hypothetical protein